MIKNFNDIPLSEKLDNQLFRNGLIKTMLAGITDGDLKSKFEVEKIQKWLTNGAKPTQVVSSLLKKAEIIVK